jgi:hypothetical protein
LKSSSANKAARRCVGGLTGSFFALSTWHVAAFYSIDGQEEEEEKMNQGQLLQPDKTIAVSVEWTRFNGNPLPRTGWLIAPRPVAAGVYVLKVEDGSSGSVSLLADAEPGKATPFCLAAGAR